MLNKLFIWFYQRVGGAEFLMMYQGSPVYLVTKLIPAWAHGQALGEIIFIRSDMDEIHIPAMLIHEHEHVLQFRREGIMFWVRYFGQYLKNLWFKRMPASQAYSQISYEKAARLAESEYWGSLSDPIRSK